MRRFRHLSLEALQILSLLCLLGIPYLFWVGQGYAAELTDRSITISSAVPGATTSHTFNMNINTSSAVGSIVFSYCANSPIIYDSCTPPAGLVVNNATLTNQSGNAGFSFDSADSTVNQIVINRPALITTPGPSSYSFGGIINPSSANVTTYVRISTYSSSDGSGSFIDNGSVAFTTANNFQVGAYVPPYLNLCVAVIVAADCSQASGNNLDLGILSPSTTGAASSQLAASTNDFTGYSLFVLGQTMTSGNNVIPANTNPLTNLIGASEFGINLRRNSNPAVGADPTGNGTATLNPGYASPNFYVFNSGDQIANASTSTYYNRLTVSYIVNVNAGQPPGLYSTTLTYLASAQF